MKRPASELGTNLFCMICWTLALVVWVVGESFHPMPEKSILPILYGLLAIFYAHNHFRCLKKRKAPVPETADPDTKED